jgi:DNA-binding GntR family transcriptional regulator
MELDPPSRRAESAGTLTTSIYERLKADILSTHLEPGRKLQSRFLMESYGVGQTPLREALNRLSTEGLVVSLDQRGFHVKDISAAELIELTKTRCWVEATALGESIAHATPDWEEALVLAHHRLNRAPRSLDPEQFEHNPQWEVHHRAFHALLISRCGSRPLIEFCAQLADRLYRYRMLSMRKSFRTRKVNDEHAGILEAVLERNSAEAIAQLTAHYRSTASILEADLKALF